MKMINTLSPTTVVALLLFVSPAQAGIQDDNFEASELQNIRNIIEVANDRMKWKIEELLPVGLIIKQVDDLLK